MIFTTYFGCHCSIYDLGQRIMVVVSYPLAMTNVAIENGHL